MIGQAVAAATGPHVVRLDSLTAAQRNLVLALVQTMKAAPAVSETSAEAATGGRCAFRAGDPRPT